MSKTMMSGRSSSNAALGPLQLPYSTSLRDMDRITIDHNTALGLSQLSSSALLWDMDRRTVDQNSVLGPTQLQYSALLRDMDCRPVDQNSDVGPSRLPYSALLRDMDRRTADQDRKFPTSPVSMTSSADRNNSLHNTSMFRVNTEGLAKSHSKLSSSPAYSTRPILGCSNRWNHQVHSPTRSDGSTNSSVDISDLMSSLSVSPPGRLYVAPTEQEISKFKAMYTLSSTVLMNNALGSSPRLPRNAAWPSTSNVNNLGRTSPSIKSWVGDLPRRFEVSPTYSCKVFLGGVPWDMTEAMLISLFFKFGKIRVEWPGKENAAIPPKGYVYIIFETESQVKMLLNCCTRDIVNGNYENYFFRIYSYKMRPKAIEVIPWRISDTNHVVFPSQKLDPFTTVFVGGLHGVLTAQGLYKIMDDLFGGVAYVGIDTDKYKYPIGSARVTFNSRVSYIQAVRAAFIDIRTNKFVKKVQVDPYLEDAVCSKCLSRQGPFFCKEFCCFRYFCTNCWLIHHQSQFLIGHRPMERTSKYARETPSRHLRFGYF